MLFEISHDRDDVSMSDTRAPPNCAGVRNPALTRRAHRRRKRRDARVRRDAPVESRECRCKIAKVAPPARPLPSSFYVMTRAMCSYVRARFFSLFAQRSSPSPRTDDRRSFYSMVRSRDFALRHRVPLFFFVYHREELDRGRERQKRSKMGRIPSREGNH